MDDSGWCFFPTVSLSILKIVSERENGYFDSSQAVPHFWQPDITLFFFIPRWVCIFWLLFWVIQLWLDRDPRSICGRSLWCCHSVPPCERSNLVRQTSVLSLRRVTVPILSAVAGKRCAHRVQLTSWTRWLMPMEIGIQLLKYCLGLNIITSKSSKFQLPNRFSCTKHPSKTLRQCWSGTAPWSSQSCHVPDGIHGTVAMQPRIACFQVTINLDELTLGTVFDQLITLLDCHPILAGNTASFGPLKFPIIHLYRTLDPAWLCPWRKTKHCMPWTWTMNISRQKCHFEPKTRGIHWERQYTMYTHQDQEYYRTLKKSSPFSKFLPQWYNVDIWAQILLASVPNKSSTENFFVFQGASCFQQSAQLIPEVLGCNRDPIFTGGFWTRELPVTLPIFSYSHWRQMVKNGEKSPNRPSVDLLQGVTCISCHVTVQTWESFCY